MALFRTLSMLLGALAVLWLGATPISAVSAEAPSCHEMSMDHGAPAEAPSPDKPMKAMGCCVACVAAPLPQPPVRAALRAPTPTLAIGPQTLPVGRTPTPEPGPPRTVVA